MLGQLGAVVARRDHLRQNRYRAMVGILLWGFGEGGTKAHNYGEMFQREWETHGLRSCSSIEEALALIWSGLGWVLARPDGGEIHFRMLTGDPVVGQSAPLSLSDCDFQNQKWEMAARTLQDRLRIWPRSFEGTWQRQVQEC